MESREKNIFKKIFNKETKIMRKKNNKEESKLDNNNKYLIKNNILKGNQYIERNISFRKEYKNDKIRNKNINRTLNDIYSTINSINKINKKIYKIFSKKTTKENNKNSEKNKATKCINNYFYGKNSIKNKLFNEIQNKSNNEKRKKNLIRNHYSCDNIFKNKINSIKAKKETKNINEIKKLDDNSILYISSFITEELNRNKINNKLNYDYNDIHLRDKLNDYKNDKKLKKNLTYDNIFALNHFRNSKNFKDIVMLEKIKQNEFQKLENINHLKNNYQRDEFSYEKNEFNEFNINLNNNKQISKKKPFCFNELINKSYNTSKNNNEYYKSKYINSFFHKIFSIKNENDSEETVGENIYTKNYNTNIINKLNVNYQIYKNILNNN